MLISITDIIKNSYNLFRTHRALFLKYAEYLFIPSGVIILLANLSTLLTENTSKTVMIAFSVTLFLAAIAISLISLWISIALIRAISDCYEARTPKNPREELRVATFLLWPVIMVSILTSTAVIGGFILFVIPALIFSIWFAFGTTAVILDNKRGTEAMSWSKQLVVGRWWGVILRLFIPAFLFGSVMVIAQQILSYPFQVLVRTLQVGTISYLFTSLAGGLLSAGVGAILTPLATMGSIILYIELKKTYLPIAPPSSEVAPPSAQ